MNTNWYSQPDLDQLAQDWSLTHEIQVPPDATMVVAGAYQGKLIHLLSEMFPTYNKIIGYEPCQWAYEKCVERVGKLREIYLYQYGLYADKGFHELSMGEFGTDACSLLTEDREQGKGYFYDARMCLLLRNIDLFVLNVEGYEYILLPYLHKTGILDNIQQIACQFHEKYKTDDSLATIDMMDTLYKPLVNDYPKWVLWAKR